MQELGIQTQPDKVNPNQHTQLNGILSPADGKSNGLVKSFSYAEFQEMVKDGAMQNPYATSASFMMAAINQTGIAKVPQGTDYNFFTTGENAESIYGLLPTKAAIVSKIGTEADTNRRDAGILFVGPTGSGKTLFSNALKKGLEDYSKWTTPPAMYQVDGCPIQENPANLSNKEEHLRLKKKGINLDYPCPHCRTRLENEFHGDPSEMLVKPLLFSADSSIGIATLDPQTTSVFDQASKTEINDIIKGSNRGILHITELLRHNPAFITHLYNILRGREAHIGRFTFHLDNLILGDTTLDEWKKFSDNKENEAMVQRWNVIYVPYTTSVEQEAAIEAKAIQTYIRSGTTHISPTTQNRVAEVAVRTRLKDSEQPNGPKINDKLTLYDGLPTPNFQPWQAALFETEGYSQLNEGLEGISPPAMSRVLGEIMHRHRISGSNDITRYDFKPNELKDPDIYEAQARLKRSAEFVGCLAAFKALAVMDTYFKPTGASTYASSPWTIHITATKNSYDKWIQERVLEAYRTDHEPRCVKLGDLYVENAEKLDQQDRGQYKPNIDPVTKIDLNAPNTDLIKQIEDAALGDDATEEQIKKLRKDVLTSTKHGQKFDYKAVAELAKGIRQVISGVSEDDAETLKTQTPSPKQQKLLDATVRRLITDNDFCIHCGPEALAYVQSILRKKQ